MTNHLFPPFFESNHYFIDEKVNFFKFENAYKVYSMEGTQVGNIVQKLSAGQKLLRLIVNKSMLPFLLEVKDMEDRVLVTIKRGFTFFLSKIIISDSNGIQIGTIRQKFKIFKPTFKISDANDVEIAAINGDWVAWNFTIKDSNGQQIGTISKKWAGAMQELFTTADKYNVHIEEAVLEDQKKIAIVACAITIDMVLKESK